MKNCFRGLQTWKRTLLRLVALGFVLVTIVGAAPLCHLIIVYSKDQPQRAPIAEGYVDDASRLNLTAVREIIYVNDEAEAAEEQIRELLEEATAKGWKVSIAGARHSMGGHTIYPGGVALDMRAFNSMEMVSDNVLRVGSGAHWSEVIPFLDKLGKSVAVMQSNNSFSVGGSISVNCHGWQYGKPPIASTVKQFRIMRANGDVVRCSREENAELFSLALGGYGLFGVILDVDLEVVPNIEYQRERFVVETARAIDVYDEKVRDGKSTMAFARLNVMGDKLFEKIIINRYVSTKGIPSPISARGAEGLKRTVFRGSEGSEFGKGLRWVAERYVEPIIAEDRVSRNHLLNEGAELYENRNSESTDILHEYFIPCERAGEFIKRLKSVLIDSELDLLNVTVRYVDHDKTCFLKYADQEMLSFVMLFAQKMNQSEEMDVLGRKLVDLAIVHGGRHYLPYRNHASRQQFYMAYPMAYEFFKKKREYDPHGIFQNMFYSKYGLEELSMADSE